MNFFGAVNRLFFVSILFLISGYALAGDDVPLNANDISPLLVGETIPDVTLQNIEGKAVKLQAAVSKQPTLIIFYRGSWCPYCNTHLGELAKLEPELIKMGIQILAISPDKPKYLQEAIDKNDLKYTLLSDSKAIAIKAFGLAFKLDSDTVKKYKEWGIDLEKQSGESHFILPVPAAYLVKPDGQITFSFTAPNYKIRVNGDVLMAAARQLVDSK